MSDEERIKATRSIKDKILALEAEAIACGVEIKGTMILIVRNREDASKVLSTRIVQL